MAPLETRRIIERCRDRALSRRTTSFVLGSSGSGRPQPSRLMPGRSRSAGAGAGAGALPKWCQLAFPPGIIGASV